MSRARKFSPNPPVLVWLRDDLRIADNLALLQASKSGKPVVCLYVVEDADELRPLGGAAKWWLYHSLRALAKALNNIGGALTLRKGDPRVIVPGIASEIGAGSVYWNRRYHPGGIAIDSDIKSMLKLDGLTVQSFNAALLYEPWEIKTGSGQAYKVFTPFWKAAQATGSGAKTYGTPSVITSPDDAPDSDLLDKWRLLPVRPNWAKEFEVVWVPGAAGAMVRLTAFLRSELKGYAEKRDFPALEATSGLSPHLRFGEISPRQIRDALYAVKTEETEIDCCKFMAEIGWREFSKLIEYSAENLARINWRREFDAFAWNNNEDALQRWQAGQTGYPLVDAGMRELWKTGSMHNRVRMVTASFLTKHLRIDWRKGEAWFWDTLVDADTASNPASWQWVTGSGADAAPYFRIFNPILQSKKFDKEGVYIRRFVPELSKLPNKYIHTPWEAPKEVLEAAGVVLGLTYPEPIVDHAKAREAAMAAYREMKGKVGYSKNT